MKTCSTCGEEKPPSAYYLKTNGRLMARCIVCFGRASSEWHKQRRTEASRQRDVAYIRRWRFQHKYGISEEEYDRMFAAQHGRCAVCDEFETKVDRGVVYRLSVDHDHQTGRVRVLLCNACNRAIGGLRDDPALLRRVAAYTEHHRRDV